MQWEHFLLFTFSQWKSICFQVFPWTKFYFSSFQPSSFFPLSRHRHKSWNKLISVGNRFSMYLEIDFTGLKKNKQTKPKNEVFRISFESEITWQEEEMKEMQNYVYFCLTFFRCWLFLVKYWILAHLQDWKKTVHSTTRTCDKGSYYWF